MSFYLLDRTCPESPAPACRPLTRVGGSLFMRWGRFRIRVRGYEGEAVFEDLYDLTEASPSCASRNSVTLDLRRESRDILLGAHVVLPDGFKGKSLHTQPHRIHCDYSRKSGAPHGYFSVLALLLLKPHESMCLDDWWQGRRRVLTAIWTPSGKPEITESCYER